MTTEGFVTPIQPPSWSLSDGDVHVWCADLREQWPESALYSLLSEDERVRAWSFAFEEDRRRYLHARGFLRILLGNYLGRSPGSVRLTTGRNGKPCLPPDNRVLRFNISHARVLVLCALAREREVGVDVEWRDRKFLWRDVVAYICSEREQTALSSLAEPVQSDTFFSWWTLKEAYVKALGAGLELPLNRIDVADGLETRFAAPVCDNLTDHRWAMLTLPMGSDYAGALVTEGIPARVRCFQWAWVWGKSGLPDRK
ncbi:MAG: 4'-phosphopantetheinyl transferase superfamily protein [Nitrospira sp.]|nr:4'-phosphopantetheinyl transferase superfamily protein [Nitrospira sp.]